MHGSLQDRWSILNTPHGFAKLGRLDFINETKRMQENKTRVSEIEAKLVGEIKVRADRNGS